jgi:hypothetical protein
MRLSKKVKNFFGKNKLFLDNWGIHDITVDINCPKIVNQKETERFLTNLNAVKII